ncbi:EAL domain-containing protein [Mycobacterium sp. PS03-16]|uniref:putative bifunctional diguanylate cyclase/phosphodiesterase n=1 Tax=Mycobacterium sp. PS03-16 TaxID=2559611 RepID=UPI001073645B|nr:EAL domain-containing protein [Mycobacterium sp. PS03-16]TFV60226.1 EAL domain-containing protein [Mycobacterium sp. PS03-16]
MLLSGAVGRGALSIKGYPFHLGLLVTVIVAVLVNASAPWGDHVARIGEVVLQASVGVSVMVCAAVVARRERGVAKTWRLLVLAAMSSWLIAESLWWLSGPVVDDGPAPAVGVVAYFLPPVLSLAAMVLLARAGNGAAGRADGSGRPSRIVAVLDGLVAAASFSILMILAGAGAVTGASVPRSDSVAVVVAYSLLELAVVVVAVLMAMAFPRNRRYRGNYLLLSTGVLLIASSERLIAYLYSVDMAGAVMWGAVGFTLGPLLILFAVLDRPSRERAGTGEDAMDWAQLVMPYIAFIGVANLLAFHLIIGRRLGVLVICVTLLLVVLIAVRQVIAMRAQRQLTGRLYEVQRRLAHQVHHDSLTGLPNRVLFAERLEEAIDAGRFVLIFVDLDDFKEVNDQFGHAAGDELLRAVGERLQRCVTPADTLARIGGDEFAILVDGEHDAPEVVADRLRVALRQPFAVHGSSVRVHASMGLVRPSINGSAPTPDDLLRQADISMYAGKRLGKNTAVVYQPSAGESIDFPTALRLAGGGAPDGFGIAYQPVVRLPDGHPTAIEALARWTAPSGIQIPPETFVAVAESAGLGAVLDHLVLDLACREVVAAGLDLDIHINVGAARLGNREFEQRLAATLARHGLPPSRLVVEITEKVPIVDLADGAAAIRRLTASGVKVALDDFGAGYNSLVYLHSLPVQIVKLDRSLAVGAEADVTLYRSVIGLCHALGLEVIAEGIESRAQADMIAAAGGHLVQGHLFGRAMPIGELVDALAARP